MDVDFEEYEKPWVSKAERYCALEEQCVWNVRRKLEGWGAPQASADKIVAYLQDAGFIDESRYARLFCESKLRHQHWGRVKIAYQLRQRQVPQSAIQEGLSDLSETLYDEILHDLAQSKWDSLRGIDDYTRRYKVTSFLQSRGFEMSAIQEVIKNIKK